MATRSSDAERDSWFADKPPTGVAARLGRLSSALRTKHAASERSLDPREPATGTPASPTVEGRSEAATTGAGGGLGSRVAQARHEAGLTTKELSQRLGLSLHQTERLETGDQAAALVPSIAAATAKPVEWFYRDTAGAPDAAAPSAGPDVEGRATRAAGGDASTAPVGAGGSDLSVTLVLASLVLLVVVRFFTEVVVVLPRFANFVDVPIFLTIMFVALLRAKPLEQRQTLTPLLLMIFGLIALCALSTLTNLSRVDLAPALVFVYGFLGPIGLFVAVHSLWPVGAAIKLSRLLIALCVLQLVIAFAIDLPLFLGGASPDVISGTFGENPYQLVFFLLVMVGLLAGVFTFEKRRLAARFTPVLLIAILAVIFLAQYRSLLATTALTIVLLAVMLSSMGTRGVLVAAVSATALLGTMTYLAQTLPELKFQATIEDSGGDPTIYVKERLSRLDVIERVFGDTPRFALTGTGPGTYSSRAWRTFALDSDSDADVAGDYVLLLTQGRPYHTDVSDKYVAPQLRNQEYISGSTAVTRPFASYLSLLAEVGVFGFLLVVGAYVWALMRAGRMALASGRAALPGDPLPGLCCAATVAFFVLLQMAILDNWLEVTRITFIAWIVLAVAMKEFEGRRQLHV